MSASGSFDAFTPKGGGSSASNTPQNWRQFGFGNPGDRFGKANKGRGGKSGTKARQRFQGHSSAADVAEFFSKKEGKLS